MKRLFLAVALTLAWSSTASAQIISPGYQTINAADECVTWNMPGGAYSVTAQVTGTFSGTITFRGTSDGQTYFDIAVTDLETMAAATTATGTGQYALANAGLVKVRACMTTYSSGGANISLTRGYGMVRGTGFPSVTVNPGPITVTSDSLGTTSFTGLLAENNTAAAAGAQQYSPRACWEGQGWKTDATAASQSLVGCVEMRPIQGAASPGGGLHWSLSIDGGSFVRTGYVGYAPSTSVDGFGLTALGYNAGASNFSTSTEAYNNTFIGGESGQSNTAGHQNTFLGSRSGFSNTTGDQNTLIGQGAGFSGTTVSFNVGVGFHALLNTLGGSNTAVGSRALEGASGSTASDNTAVGEAALRVATSAASNAVVGRNGGVAVTTGSRNALIGEGVAFSLTEGADNVFAGYRAGYTATPANATTTGAQNVFLGSESGSSTTSQLTNAIAIGYRALAGASNTAVIGNTSITDTTLRGQVLAGASVRSTAVTFAGLPASPVEGMLVPVTDSSTATWGDVITGGGANRVLAYYNGTNWTVAAK